MIFVIRDDQDNVAVPDKGIQQAKVPGHARVNGHNNSELTHQIQKIICVCLCLCSCLIVFVIGRDPSSR